MKADEHWKKIESQHDDDLDALMDMRKISHLPSIDPLQKIKRNLIDNSILALLVVAIYIFIFIKFPLWQVRICMGVMIIFTAGGFYSAMKLFSKINRKVTTNSLLQELERHYNNIQTWMSMQQNIGLFLYPIGASGGFMLGGYVGSGKSINEFMGKPIVIVILIITIAILMPICAKITKWLSKKLFGQYVAQLKNNIDALKGE